MSDNTNTCTCPDHLKRDPQDCTPEQVEHCHGAGKDHDCIGSEEQGILKAMKEKSGSVPGTVALMAKRPGLLGSFMKGYKNLLDQGPLTERERFLVALSASTALKTAPCISSHVSKARKAGATDDEVLQTMLISGMIANTTVLHVAADAADIFHDNAEKTCND